MIHHPEYDALLAAVLEDPEGEAVRFVLSDWLMDQGYPLAWKMKHPGGWEIVTDFPPASKARQRLFWVPNPDPEPGKPGAQVGTLERAIWCAGDPKIRIPMPPRYCTRYAQMSEWGRWWCWPCAAKEAAARHEAAAALQNDVANLKADCDRLVNDARQVMGVARRVFGSR